MARLTTGKKSRPVPKLEPRIIALTLFIAVTLSAAALRLYYLQIIKHHDLSQLADRNRIRIQRMPALRGLVYDVHHRPLVDTRPSFDAVMVPEDAPDLGGTVNRLEQLLAQDGAAKRLEDAQEQGRPDFEPVTVEERLNWQQVVTLETHQLELPGVTLQVNPQRHYIYGPLASHLLGYVGEVTVKDLARLPDYRMGDEIGKFGLERSWEDTLRGDSGGQQIEVDAVGRRLRLLREIPEKPGDSIVMTIDFDLQRVAEQAIGDRAGALVALDPNTGYILALASHPAFDPNVFAGGITSLQWRSLTTDPAHPLQDRATQGAYPPGSTFKIVDSIAALSDRTLSAQTAYYCPGGMYFGGREYRCWRKQGHGTISVHRAIIESCDVFFYNVGQHLGVDRLAAWAHALGLGQKTGIELGNERSGVIPSAQWKWRRYRERWYPAETLSVAIGQGYVAVTPLQLAELAAEIGNGGIFYQPQFVKEIDSIDGTPVKVFPPIVRSRVRISPAVLEQVRSGMVGVVNAADGTAHGARLDDVIVAGKTGTAQVIKEAQGVRVKENQGPERYRDHGWFMAFAPVDHPRIAVACIIEHGGHGGSSAGPVVKAVMQEFFMKNPPQGITPGQLTQRTSNARLASALSTGGRVNAH
ncbi:MAG: penicillin-binding protein 2, partial [Deltaproteobacteria bacterium]|nr:penicillin-binding protein 2 [Deltaproteobacteria bacterium]